MSYVLSVSAFNDTLFICFYITHLKYEFKNMFLFLYIFNNDFLSDILLGKIFPEYYRVWTIVYYGNCSFKLIAYKKHYKLEHWLVLSDKNIFKIS